MENELQMAIGIALVFALGYFVGNHHAVEHMTTKISQDPEGFIHLLKNFSKNTNSDELEFQRQGHMIYCYGKEYGFIAQATTFETLARKIREQLPNSEFIIPSDQKDFSTDELYEISKHLIIKSVDNA